MDFLVLLSSISKISLLAFIGISFFLGYEIYLFRKEQQKKTKPNLPEFSNVAATPLAQTVVIKEKKKMSLTKADNRLLIFLIILFVLFGLITVVGLIDFRSKNSTEKPVLQERSAIVPSKGIRLYDQEFRPLSDSSVSASMTVLIGVETIKEADIDRARIRINKSVWDSGDITTNFNKENSIYYQSFLIASGESRLKIEAQLHSAKDGWLGE